MCPVMFKVFFYIVNLVQPVSAMSGMTKPMKRIRIYLICTFWRRDHWKLAKQQLFIKTCSNDPFYFLLMSNSLLNSNNNECESALWFITRIFFDVSCDGSGFNSNIFKDRIQDKKHSTHLVNVWQLSIWALLMVKNMPWHWCGPLNTEHWLSSCEYETEDKDWLH